MPGAKNPDRRRIRIRRTYSVPEVAALLDVHVHTVRRWLKDGLGAIDGRSPTLIHGAELRGFLDARAEGRKQKCGPDEMFCLSCRAPRLPILGSVYIADLNEKTVRLAGVCCTCDRKICRAGSASRLQEYTASFGPLQRRNPSLKGSSIPLLDRDSKEQDENGKVQRGKRTDQA
ncbi:helix-turn-helix domain-containing protein [Vannielia litorea]|uniref:helix-turn-helix domain-containing protein n=1 Tax=Vannielia litorea TaxID=1217970 RepID=UPI00094122AB